MRQGLVGDALGRPGRRLAYVAVERFGNAGEEVPFGTGKRRVKLPPTAGRFNKRRIFVNGIEVNKLAKGRVPYLRRKMGIVFQDFRLLPNKTAQENVAFAMEVIEAPRRLIRRRVRDVLDLVGLVGKADALPRNLSGGEQQRVAIARAIVNRPLLLIADEPTGNLDPETSQDIMEVFKKINHMGTTVLMVTHDKTLVDMMNKRVIEIDGGKVVRDEQKGGYDDET